MLSIGYQQPVPITLRVMGSHGLGAGALKGPVLFAFEEDFLIKELLRR
jgi:hypothetical protein